MIVFIMLNLLCYGGSCYIRLKQHRDFKFKQQQLIAQIPQLRNKLKSQQQLIRLNQAIVDYQNKLQGRWNQAGRPQHRNLSEVLAITQLNIIQLEEQAKDNRLSYEVKMQANFCQILHFLKEVQQILPVVYFSHLQIEPDKGKDKLLLEGSLNELSIDDSSQNNKH